MQCLTAGTARAFNVWIAPHRHSFFFMRIDVVSTPVRMTVQWFVPSPESGSIVAALHALMVAVRAEPGCSSCHLTTEMGERAGLSYTEEWKGEEDLKRQLRSERFSRLAELMERATEQPKIEFALPGGVRGIEYAEAVREGGTSR
jgi:quinol monooxygenase YgiN